jgi:hypothetical protein
VALGAATCAGFGFRQAVYKKTETGDLFSFYAQPGDG